MMKKLTFALLCLIMSMSMAMAQVTKVTGHVTSAEDGEPVIGASIVVKGTTVGTVTDFDGNFTLEIPDNGKILIISYIGMATQEVKVAPRITVSLQSDTQDLDEVIVTGYGVTKKAAFTGAAQVVSSENLVKRTDANFMKSLEGSVAGLQVNSFTGQPGAFSSTTIRGMGSVNSGTEPLYVVDGIAIYTDKMGGYSKAGSGDLAASPLANINPNDIESVTVLKDATATAIYGARAANGVIVISTKKGNKGKARFNFNAKVGSSLVGRLDNNYKTVNLDNYKTIWAEGLVNSGDAANMEDGASLLNDYVNAYYGVDLSENVQSVDWLDAILSNGFTQEYDLSVQGGNESLRYYISGGYFQNDGIVVGTGMKRYSGRFNLDGNSGRIGYGLSVSGALSDINNSMTESQYTNPIVAVYDLRPFEQIYNADGSYNLDALYNPIALNDKEKGDKKNQKQITLVVNPYFTYKFMDGLTWKTNAGLNIIDLDEFFYNSIYNPQYSGSGMLGQRNQERATTLSITNTINFTRSFNELHNINVLLGQEAQKISFRNIYAAASGYPSDAVFELDNASTPTGAGSMSKASTLASFFFNGEYNYNNKYYGSASFRYDGSSRFGANNKWAPFWSVGAKYRISQEDFMENTKGWLTDLTVRGSYGTVGNQDIGYFAAMGLYNYGYSYNSEPGAIPYQIANPDLKWETVGKADIGISGVLFERFSFELDYYNQRTKDMIFDVPLSYTTGFASILKNIGTMENQGFEFLINASIINNKDFSWSVNLTGTANRNKIIKLATDKPIEGTTTIRKVGEAYYTFYMPEYAGVDPETGDPLWYKGKEGNETTSNINEAGQRIVGSADPKFYGGFGMNFRYKGFDFSFDASYTLGNKVYNSGFAYDMQVGHYFLGPVSNYVYENRWQKPGDVTDVPKFIAGSTSNANAYSSRFLMNGSYLRMKSVVLGYTLPQSILKPLTIDNLRVFVSADNLFTITAKDYIGFDPQTRANGSQSWAYPVPTTVMFGLNLGF
ncbi:SusC/RagA family TonB-linked outer membrane protein [Parabacteroides bouchesdurhonensis]|uniref:SusC/RagA family TonB-linked outer membrane protein n=1 Tax=Parabacteroides bouchesdurhonensis TaxID=1936995 RepID=UPI000C86338D|nr:TonB-dependent receptor [Parabacteroides bouchesdurhonensis]